MNRFAAIRAGYGLLLLLAPDPLIALITGRRADHTTRTVARLLGARHVTQALATLGTPSPVVLALGIEADVAHSLSMLTLAGLDRDRRHGALTDAAIAGSFALTATIAARHTDRQHPPHPAAPAGLGARRDAAAAAIANWALPAPVMRRLRSRLPR